MTVPAGVDTAKSQRKQQFDPLKEYANDSTDEEPSAIKQEASEDDDSDEAPVTDNFFVKSVSYKKKQLEDGEGQSKRARLCTFEVPLDEYTEELYEFGKFVAEQLMCLDVEEARVAQAEIRALLSKFDANRIMHCTAEPSTSNVQPTTYKHRTVMTQAVTQKNYVGSQTVISNVYSTNPQSKQLVLTPDGSSATQSSLQVNSPGPSEVTSVRKLVPSFTNSAVLNVNTSKSTTAPSRYVIVPKATIPKLNLTTQLRSVEGTFEHKPSTVIQTISDTFVGPTSTQVGSSLVISAGPDLEPESVSSSMTYDETLVKLEPECESLYSHVNVMLPSLSNNQGLLVIKHEQYSEEET